MLSSLCRYLHASFSNISSTLLRAKREVAFGPQFLLPHNHVILTVFWQTEDPTFANTIRTSFQGDSFSLTQLLDHSFIEILWCNLWNYRSRKKSHSDTVLKTFVYNVLYCNVNVFEKRGGISHLDCNIQIHKISSVCNLFFLMKFSIHILKEFHLQNGKYGVYE